MLHTVYIQYKLFYDKSIDLLWWAFRIIRKLVPFYGYLDIFN